MLALALVLVACAGAPTAHDPAPADPQRSAGARSPRDLTAAATFAELASAARRQDELRDQESEAGCLVRASGEGFRLEADLAVAVRPLPVPEEDLDVRLERSAAPILVLSRFGPYGAAGSDLALVAMTTALPPTRGTALALFVTDRGLYVRRTDRDADARDASRPEWVLEHTAWQEADLVVVAAEARIPVSELVGLLARLPASLSGRVALGVALPEGTRLPEAPAPLDPTGAALCPDGLAELGEEAPLGDLAPERIRAGLDPLHRAAGVCVGSAGRGAAGGRVAITVRLAPDGRVSDACVSEDSTGDAALRACLSLAARQLVFDAPGGYVDFALPLVLEPGRAQRQAAVCP